jgi:hypothetical protein
MDTVQPGLLSTAWKAMTVSSLDAIAHLFLEPTRDEALIKTLQREVTDLFATLNLDKVTGDRDVILADYINVINQDREENSILLAGGNKMISSEQKDAFRILFRRCVQAVDQIQQGHKTLIYLEGKPSDEYVYFLTYDDSANFVLFRDKKNAPTTANAKSLMIVKKMEVAKCIEQPVIQVTQSTVVTQESVVYQQIPQQSLMQTFVMQQPSPQHQTLTSIVPIQPTLLQQQLQNNNPFISGYTQPQSIPVMQQAVIPQQPFYTELPNIQQQSSQYFLNQLQSFPSQPQVLHTQQYSQPQSISVVPQTPMQQQLLNTNPFLPSYPQQQNPQYSFNPQQPFVNMPQQFPVQPQVNIPSQYPQSQLPIHQYSTLPQQYPQQYYPQQQILNNTSQVYSSTLSNGFQYPK